ncbi:MAG: hypothetical protein Q7S21_07010 [archaeon]|nr:hypothetical protein [archaeon]
MGILKKPVRRKSRILEQVKSDKLEALRPLAWTRRSLGAQYKWHTKAAREAGTYYNMLSPFQYDVIRNYFLNGCKDLNDVNKFIRFNGYNKTEIYKRVRELRRLLINEGLNINAPRTGITLGQLAANKMLVDRFQRNFRGIEIEHEKEMGKIEAKLHRKKLLK